MSTTHSAIEWTGRTWNPLRGCTAVSAGCTNCYAATLAARWNGPGLPYEGLTRRSGGRAVWTGRVQLVENALTEPLRWRFPALVFVNSMSDLFHEAVPDEFIDRVFAIMAVTPQHTYQILTKRPERMAEYCNRLTSQVTLYIDRTAGMGKAQDLNRARHDDGYPRCWPLENVWLGTSVEDQAAADARIPHLLRTPAVVRFISAEPLLGPVDLDRPYTVHSGDGWDAGVYPLTCDEVRHPRISFGPLSWVITGGESGPRARALNLDWTRSLRDQCAAANVPFLFKQVGGRTPKAGGRLLDGVEHHEFPAVRV